MLDRLITADQSLFSEVIQLSKCFGLLATNSTPNASSRVLTSDDLRTSCISWLIFSRMRGLVFPGATTENQVEESTAGTPLSSNVGTSGRDRTLPCVATASALRPSFPTRGNA